jgi:uridylate kinase
MTEKTDKVVIISLGGSLVVPENVDTIFVREFKILIEKYLKKDFRFVLIVGGGKLARNYISAADIVEKITDEDKDWIGIHATRMNAHFIRTIFYKDAYKKIITNEEKIAECIESKSPIIIASGWRPGNSTDLIAVNIAKHLGSKHVVNLSNISYVYDKDPGKYFTAQEIKKISWKDFRNMFDQKWSPGLNIPFDPVASEMAEKEGFQVAIMNGKNLSNLEKYLEGKEFDGTIIE